MASSKTSLDLLSQAAELVNTAMAPSIAVIKTSTKDLPTRGKKLMRTRSRRNLPITSVADNKKDKNGVSPQLSPKKDPSLLSFAYIFPKGPSVETENTFVPHMSSSYPPPPPYTSPGDSLLLKSKAASSYPRESFFKGPPSPPVFVMDTSSPEDELDEDRPLDMSKKCGRSYDSHQQARPSVITCASALYSSKCHHLDKSCLCSHHPSSTKKSESESENSDECVVETRTGHRREVSSGMCDPVIDEHFRRSLGKDYSEIFASTTSNTVVTSVDDHFAKALGDTWLRLQKPESKDSNLTKTHSLKRTPSLVTL